MLHGSAVEPVVEFGDVSFEVFVFDGVVGPQQEAFQVGQRDVDPGEEFMRRLVLLGQLGGRVDEAVLLRMPVSVPTVGQDYGCRVRSCP